ncbi:acyltransferase [Thomasclavelia cocleata]|uniref:acyltransferase n=1 Tax=Thomasclavelia cocleata TaxID=69824 RepID=UPI00258EC93C|nr:acyltransferase [Thomasclavelia cocleata]
MRKIDKLKRRIVLFIINNFLSTTKFFTLKRKLLNIGNIKVGKGSKVVGPFFCGTEVEISIGDNCWIGNNFKVEGNGKIRIANNCDFAPSVMIITGSHEISDRKRAAGRGIDYSIDFEDGCWIGARSTLFGNITIGKLSVIGAMSLVNRTVEEYCVVAGNPFKLIRKI